MKAIVIYPFFDLEDETKHIYAIGDTYPYDQRKISEARLKELSSSKNKIGRPLIKLESQKVDNKSDKPKTTKKKSNSKKEEKSTKKSDK